MRFATTFAAAALAVGLMAAQTANAGIVISGTATGDSTDFSFLNASVQAGLDPLNQPQRQILAFPKPDPLKVGESDLDSSPFSLSQSYDPPSGGAPEDILSAIGKSSSLGIFNTKLRGKGTDITLVLTMVFDGFKYPDDNPMNWISNISSTLLFGGATLTATASVTDDDQDTPDYTVNHSKLTGDITSNPASQNIFTLVEPSRSFRVTQTLTVFLPADSAVAFEMTDTLTAANRIPEPTTLALVGASLLGLGVARRYRRRTH